MGRGKGENDLKVSFFPADFYASLRTHRVMPGDSLRESDDGPPNERLLQRAWAHQRLRRDQLTLVDGRRLRVLHPGFWNREAGPDFRKAVFQIAEEEPVVADVEIDIDASGWKSHGHASNPAYTGVRLHVVWNPARPHPADLPTLQLRGFLDASWSELTQWLDIDSEHLLAGRCRGPLRQLSDPEQAHLIRQAAMVRLESKGRFLLARSRLSGWRGALLEALFGALGYKHNVWPMRNIAELLLPAGPEPGTPTPHTRSLLEWQAIALGLGGLLPLESDALPITSRRCLRELWGIWWRERDRFASATLPASIWHRSGVRPANHPERRVALAAHWLARADLPALLEQWILSPGRITVRARMLLGLLQAGHDPYWLRHWNFRARTPLPRPLLGPMRTTDIAVNVILPWLWIRAQVGGNTDVRREVERTYLEWPASEDNAALRQVRSRLGVSVGLARTAAIQQGLLQIVRDFCDRSNPLCDRCEFPGLVTAMIGGLQPFPFQTLETAPAPNPTPAHIVAPARTTLPPSPPGSR